MQKLLKECKYIQEKMIKYITDDLKFSSDSSKKQIKTEHHDGFLF